MRKRINPLIFKIMLLECMFLLTMACKKDNSAPSVIVKDIDGNVYHTVTIGTQVWMVENLKTTRFNDSTAIPFKSDIIWDTTKTASYCWYNNDAVLNKAKFGALYNWYTINTGKLCPKGWHVPTDSEWTVLENYLVTFGYNYDGSSASQNTINKCAKALATDMGWEPSTAEGAVGNTDYPAKRNATGFSGLPAGFRTNTGDFLNQGDAGIWWTSTESTIDTHVAFSRAIVSILSTLNRSVDNKNFYLSVRCIKD